MRRVDSVIEPGTANLTIDDHLAGNTAHFIG